MKEKTGERNMYKDLFRMAGPIDIWTPDGTYRAPSLIDEKKMPVGTGLPELFTAAGRRDPVQRILTSGELYRIRKTLEEENPDLENSMVSGPYERTSTVLDYINGQRKRNYFYGFLVQMPEFDDNGEFMVNSKGIIRARHSFPMRLPIKSDYVKNMDPDTFDMFINTVYGMGNAREHLPDDAFVLVKPEGIKNLIHGSWGWPDSEYRRVSINADWNPFGKHEYVSARAAVENRTVYELDESDYVLALELLDRAKDVPAGRIEDTIEDAKTILSRAVVKERKI